MPASRTEAQRAAARANGRRSHGPVTAEGKARAAMNARSFGLRCAETSVIEGEDPALFAMLQASVHDHFRPSSPLEAALCARMVAALWRSSRAERLETSFWDLYPRNLPLDADNPMPQILAHDHDLQRYSLATVLRYITESDNAFARALRNLTQLRSGKADPLPGEVYLGSDATRLHRNGEPDEEEAAGIPPHDPADAPARSPAANDDVAASRQHGVAAQAQPGEPPPPPLPPATAPRPPASPICTNEPEPSPAASDSLPVASRPTPMPAAVEQDAPLVTLLGDEPLPARSGSPQPATPSEIALHELARMRANLRESCPPALLAEAEAFILRHGDDGMGPPPWVQHLPRTGSA